MNAYELAERERSKHLIKTLLKIKEEQADRIAELEKEKIRAYDNGFEDGQKSLRGQADRVAELEKLVSDMIYEKSSGVYDRPQTNSEPQKVTLYIYNNARDGKTWIDEHQNEMLHPEWKYMGKIEVLK